MKHFAKLLIKHCYISLLCFIYNQIYVLTKYLPYMEWLSNDTFVAKKTYSSEWFEPVISGNEVSFVSFFFLPWLFCLHWVVRLSSDSHNDKDGVGVEVTYFVNCILSLMWLFYTSITFFSSSCDVVIGLCSTGMLIVWWYKIATWNCRRRTCDAVYLLFLACLFRIHCKCCVCRSQIYSSCYQKHVSIM